MAHNNAPIKLAKTAGFCPGVKKAIDCVLELAQAGKTPVYTLGPLIHNTQVIKTLEEKNIRAIESIDEIKDKKGVVVIRAHGITPQEEARLRACGMEVVDATCPLVKNVHRVISQYAQKGYHTVIAGDAGHAEVTGLLGYTQGLGHVVANAQQARELPHFDKVNLVAQTTQKEAVFNDIAAALKENSGDCVISNTICHPTKERQTETVELAKSVELMIVVGGRHSANTARLAKLCGELCPNTIHIESEDELQPQQIADAASIGITAGASTPTWMTERVADRALKLKKAHTKTLAGTFEKFWALVINGSFYTGFAAVALAYISMKIQGLRPSAAMLAIPWLFVISLNILNRTAEKGVGTAERGKALFFDKYKAGAATLGIALGAAMLVLTLGVSARITALVMLFWGLGILYPFRARFLRSSGASFPGSKDIVTALGWGFVCAYVPASHAGIVFSKANYLAVFYATLLVFMRSVMLGISAVHTDLIVGRENFYKALGKTRTRNTLLAAIITLTAVLAALFAMDWNRRLAAALLAGNIYSIICYVLYHIEHPPRGIWAETVIDGQFILLGFLAFAVSNGIIVLG